MFFLNVLFVFLPIDRWVNFHSADILLALKFSQKCRWIIIWTDVVVGGDNLVAGKPTKSCIKSAVRKYGKHFVVDAEARESDDDEEDEHERAQRMREDDTVSLKSFSSHICF